MISPADFYSALAAGGVSFFSGVPDSLLKEFCGYVDAILPPESHVISANEGSAVALAAGFHLATGKLPLVYLQNSGLGNAINPLLSLADIAVYSLPLVVLVGWRGSPGVKDEPQHSKQGRVTPALLDAMEIPWREIDADSTRAEESAKWATQTSQQIRGPVALLVHKDSFSKAENHRLVEGIDGAHMSREYAISLITKTLPLEAAIVSTTGMISRELYEQRKTLGQDRSRDFLTVGSMGHASQIALGIAISRPEQQVVCVDGDGAALMHMGGLATIGSNRRGNLLHIVLNNGVHDSVGGQPTVAQQMSLSGVAKACGYGVVWTAVTTEGELVEAISKLAPQGGMKFVEVLVKPGSRSDLGRPEETPSINRDMFMQSLKGTM